MAALGEPGPAVFVVSVAAAAALAMAVFAHASKHGSRHPTAWGVATFLAAAPTILIYFIRYWVVRRRRF
jgi:hypothetical protein